MSIDLEKEKIRVVVREVLREESHIPIDLFERLVRVEEGLKNLADIMEKRFGAMEKRFEAIDKRFESMMQYMDSRFEAVDRRFEAMDKRFEAIDKRFEDVNNRFIMLTIFMSVGFAALGTLMTVFQYVH
ncbi:MAG: hypothetical protein AB1742_15890 [bacterium]